MDKLNAKKTSNEQILMHDNARDNVNGKFYFKKLIRVIDYKLRNP